MHEDHELQQHIALPISNVMTQAAPFPSDEKQRLQALRSFDILDTEPEQAFDELINVASLVCDTPIALVSLLDESRQWFKSRKGLDTEETHRDIAFCSHATLTPISTMQVHDARKDERFKNNPLVIGSPNIAFYAGSPLLTSTGKALGTLCVIDSKPKSLSDHQLASLEALSRQVVAQIEIRRTNIESRLRNDELSQFAYRVSHDFKAPLSSSKRLAELMILDISDGKLEEVKENTNRIKHQMKKLQSFVEELLNLARADLAEDKEAAVNLKSLVEEVTDNQKEIIARSGLLVTVDIPSSLCIQVTKIRIFQILDNLDSNAAKYVYRETEHSTFKITCSENESGVLLEISDNGVGIPQEEH